MGMGSLQDALNKKIQERNNKGNNTNKPVQSQTSKLLKKIIFYSFKIEKSRILAF